MRGMTLDDLSALIRQRRSLKPAAMDAARPIDRAVLMTLLENATWAPTHGLTEPWGAPSNCLNSQGDTSLALPERSL
jgi:hypothetical protein